MKKFADYFEKAIEYGESLGLRNDSEFSENCVKLDSPVLQTINVNHPFYPNFVIIWKNGSFDIESSCGLDNLNVTDIQNLKLIKLFASAYEKYLADKKEPVAADSNK